MTQVLVYAEAYAIKDELGGGFRGVAIRKTDKTILRGDVRVSLEDARNDAKRFASNLIGERLVRPGYYRPTKTQWACNYWTA